MSQNCKPDVKNQLTLFNVFNIRAHQKWVKIWKKPAQKDGASAAHFWANLDEI